MIWGLPSSASLALGPSGLLVQVLRYSDVMHVPIGSLVSFWHKCIATFGDF
jgi:hypothetical protein